MLLGLVPGFGAIAYAVSEPMLKGPGRMLVDESASRLPFKLYRRLGLARFTAPRRKKDRRITLDLPAHTAPAGQEVEREAAEAYRVAA